MKRTRSLGHRMGNRVGRATMLALARLVHRFPQRALSRLGTAVGFLGWAFAVGQRRVAQENLRQAFAGEMSERAIRRLVRQVYRHLGKGLVEFMRLPLMTDEELRRHVALRDARHFDEALAAGKGVILLTAHFGNWELMGARLCLEGYPLSVIARHQNDVRLTNLTTRLRRAKGMQVLSRDESARRVLQTLRRNELVGILIDQNTAVGGVFVDFFGRPAATAAGAAAFALRTGAAVVPAFCYRRADDTLMVQVFPRVPVENTGDRERDILVNTQRFTAVIEEQVRERPDLWLWIHRRWKARPPGERAASQGRPDA